MACGGSVGEGYGPMIVASRKMPLEEMKKLRIAVPGTLTTAYLAMKLFAPEIETETVPFDKIIPAVLAGEFDAGLIIHEGQLTYAKDGLTKLLDLGQWWREETGLPLPLGGNAIRRSLGPDVMKITTDALRDSIQHALDHREEALEYAMQVRPRSGHLAGQPLRRHVRQRAHIELWRGRPRSHPQAAGDGLRPRHHSDPRACGFRRLNRARQGDSLPPTCGMFNKSVECSPPERKASLTAFADLSGLSPPIGKRHIGRVSSGW